MSEQNLAFYNGIANNYDSILDKEGSNETIRNRVKEKFLATVKKGWVLDFGGGTGRDLDWLTASNYRVIFCEPSKGMRKKAIDHHLEKTPAGRIIFLENKQTNFTAWHEKSPFDVKVNAILSDFAVINCIDDMELLFKNLAQFLKPGGHFMALMLQYGYKKSRKWKLREFARTLFSRKPLEITVQYKRHQQTVYVYSPKEIKSASMEYFDLQSAEDMFEFTLFHFTRK